MGTITLVRHGQASLGAADYDQLSELGHMQGQRLGAYWQALGLRFDAVYTGTLKRHHQTLSAIAQGFGEALDARATASAALDEYDSTALLDAAQLHTPKPVTPEHIRLHFRALCAALDQWIAGAITPAGMPSWHSFHSGIAATLRSLQERHVGEQILVVSSGGPISTAVAAALGAPAGSMIGLNMQLRNTGVSELAITPKRLSLRSFNGLPHLATPQDQRLVTMA